MTIIDVREPYEYNQGHVEGAINIPSSSIAADPKVLIPIPKDEVIILYCASGNRANGVMKYMQHLGYRNISNGINQQNVEKNLQSNN